MVMRVCAAACLSLVLCQGCAESNPPAASGSGPVATTERKTAQEEMPPLPEQTEPVSTEAPSNVTVKVLDWPATEKLIASKKGTVVVVDFWATYCPPCVKEFPNLVQLHKKHGDKIACISVSADYEGDNIAPLDEVKGPVLEQLQKFGATFDNVLLSVNSDDFSKQIGISSVPVVMVYNKAGERIAMFPDPKNPDEFTYAKDILPIVNQALAE